MNPCNSPYLYQLFVLSQMLLSGGNFSESLPYFGKKKAWDSWLEMLQTLNFPYYGIISLRSQPYIIC
jgi:hypothetical protein